MIEILRILLCSTRNKYCTEIELNKRENCVTATQHPPPWHCYSTAVTSAHHHQGTGRYTTMTPMQHRRDISAPPPGHRYTTTMTPMQHCRLKSVVRSVQHPHGTDAAPPWHRPSTTMAPMSHCRHIGAAPSFKTLVLLRIKSACQRRSTWLPRRPGVYTMTIGSHCGTLH